MSTTKRILLFLSLLLVVQMTLAQLPSSAVDSIIHLITPYSFRLHFDSLRTTSDSFRKVTVNKVQSPDHDACRDYIFRTFQNYLGIENVHLHSFSEGEYQGLANVIGIKRGTKPEKGIIIISAHYDSSNSRESTRTNCSPGANDNGTGLAAILEIARVLSGFETEYSVLFAAWDFEEQFTNWYPTGSNRWYTDYVKKGKKKKRKNIMREGQFTYEQIIANVNFDMFGKPLDTLNGKPVLWACSGNTIHKRFVDEYVLAFEHYVPAIKAINKGRLIYSDHYTFANRKIPSVENLESGYDRDPFYHTCSDNLENTENINFEFATDVAQGGFAFLIEKAKVVSINNAKPIKIPIQFTVREVNDCYTIELCDDGYFIEVVDMNGNKVAISQEGCLFNIFPNTTGLYQIRIFSSTQLTLKNLLMQKKEGQPVPFFQ